MNYKLLKVRGYWNNDLLKSKGYRKNYSEIEQDVNIALGYWEHIDTEDIEQDDEIFYYYEYLTDEFEDDIMQEHEFWNGKGE